MKNVLYTGHFLAAHRGTVSPSERVAHHLRSHGFRINITSTKKSRYSRLLDIIICSAMFKYTINHIDVFSGRSFLVAEIASLVGKIRRKKIFLTLHGGMLPEFYQRHPVRMKNVFKRADKVFSPSLYLKRFFEKEGFGVEYLPNPIDLAKFPYLELYEPANKLVWVRAFSPIYNPTLAVETLLHVRQVFPDCTLTMIGPDKGELNKVKALMHQHHLEEAIEITGPVPNEELYRYYHSHAVFLNTTSYESFGMAVMEAAACGIPVVSTPAGEIPLLWENGKDMLITSCWSAESMADRVIQLLTNRYLANEIRQNARRKAEKYDWEEIKSRWIEILKGPDNSNLNNQN